MKHVNASAVPGPAGPVRGWSAAITYARFVRVAPTLFSLPLIIGGMLVAADGLHRAGAETGPAWHEDRLHSEAPATWPDAAGDERGAK